jgi:Zn-dependent M28 family amino/carboxypeptidase
MHWILWALLQDGISEKEIRSDVSTLADDSFEGRCAGEAGGDRAAQWMQDQFKKIGLKPALEAFEQPFAFTQRKGSQSYGRIGGDKKTRNIIGKVEGTELKESYILLTAHYDHCGRAGMAADPGRMGQAEGGDDIWNGANDNASGSAALLAVARAVAKSPLSRTAVFISLTAEEHGLLGARYYVDHPAVPLEKTVAVVNMDSVGRMNSQPEPRLNVYQVRTSADWPSLVDEAARRAGLPVKKFEEPWPKGLSSDHVPFGQKGLPAVGCFTGIVPERHTVRDHADKIDVENLAKIARFVHQLVSLASERPPKKAP